MTTELTLDRVQVDRRQRVRQTHAEREVRRLERHLRKAARRRERAFDALRRRTREEELRLAAQLMVLGYGRQL
ncbi:hypothetical protein [Xylanimonas protaetiae]|uniref:Uncharacterized protein n=1 Tax=Xylanimonas protaetiae TaxID=2509457 RepID=A0A4P6F826_9MICO|nr:hypothetical protein [Xylanimonas protaetiae]QAY70449.1 hypothetical protein ET471_10765 [Xylanimonas protaetiae]